MRQDRIAAWVIFGSFVLLACPPVLGIILVWTAPPRSVSMLGPVLMLSAPLGLLAWVAIKQKGWDQSERRFLRSCSTINTLLLTLEVLVCMATLIHGCFSGLSRIAGPGS